MLTVNIHDAKTRLSELVARAVAGEPFVIANRGKPMVKVEALEQAEKAPQRFGFLKGMYPPVDHEAWAELDREVLEMFENEWARDGGNTAESDDER